MDLVLETIRQLTEMVVLMLLGVGRQLNWLCNTDGSISATVSAETTGGFSIVKYNGTGSAATVGHGLGVAPNFIIVKNLSDDGTNWFCYHSGNALMQKQIMYF